MKKVFTLFAAALLGFCAFAQEGPCPSKLIFAPVQAEQPANNVLIELQLAYNNSANLNGFNMEATKTGGEWIMMDEILETYFTAEGYETNILAAWTGHTEAQMIANFSKMVDVMSNVKDNGNLVMIEILKTNACRFFPAVEEGSPLAIGKFGIDLSGCEDGDYTFEAPALAANCSFSYTDGPEGNTAWTADEAVVLELTKNGDVVTVKGATPVVEPITIAGNVVDANGAPLEGVTVTLDEATREAITATTGTDGTYSLQYIPEDGKNYNVTFSKDGYVNQTYDANEVPETVTLQETETPTGISTIGADNVDGRIYDLQGRELKSVPEHGIYIQNGKKHIK